ncbi:MAG: hypothetical protein KKA05_01740 [Alphaproteobacteria bacterium]|nr:hypothetical protein [Alphaproteobacteria bacterium]
MFTALLAGHHGELKMVNPVNATSVNQATLNPFQKRIEDQIKNPDAKDTQENASANQSRTEDRREAQPAQQASARNDNSSRQSAGQSRGSLVDLSV